MGAAAAVHPADPILRAYGLGKLDDVSSASVSKHLEGCDSCQRRVAELSSDEFLGRLQDARVMREKPDSGWPPSAGSSAEGTSGPVGPPPPADTLPPELVDHPDWEIIRELGRGGMGVVYLANNRLMGRPEVLKVVGRHLVERPGVLDRFLREIRAAAMLQHANIVTAYTAMRLGQSVVLAMEYVEGLDLAKMVKTKGPLPVAHACYFIHQAALGLQHAHERGMVHRDIKPANLILARDGKKAVVKVLDFGLAKVTSEGQTDSNLTREGQMVGTPDFIAPEQIRDARSADIRADIYSLGCTLYYLLTGGPPFRGEHLWDVYQAHFSMEAGPLNLVRPEVPVELAAIVAKMMAKEPGRRFQTPAEVAQALVPFFKTVSLNTRAPIAAMSPVAQAVGHGGPVDVPSPPTQRATTLLPAVAPTVKASPQPDRSEPRWESLIEFKETEQSIGSLRPKPLPASVPARRPLWASWQIIALASALGLSALAGVIYIATDTGIKADIGDSKSRVRVEVEGTKTGHKPRSGGQSPVTQTEISTVAPSPPIVDRRQFTVVAGKWSLNGGELVQADTTRWYTELLFGDDQWKDYDFTIDVMRAGGGGPFSLIFRSTDPDNEFDYTMAGDNNKTFYLHARDQRETTALRTYDFSLRNNAWYTARVQVRGNRFVCSINDIDNGTENLVFDIVDDRHPRGRVGLQTFGASVRFKNIKVTAPDGNVLWQGLPAVEAAEPTQLPAPADASKQLAHSRTGWVPRFNGTNLSGWVGELEGYEVTAGAIRSKPGKRATIFVPKEFSDFRARVEFRLSSGANSGLAIRYPGQGTPSQVGMCEVQILDDQSPQYDDLDPRQYHGSAYGIAASKRGQLRPLGEWNIQEVEVHGSKIKVELNGATILDADLSRIHSFMKNQHHPGKDRTSGYFGLTSNDGPVDFRNIQIKDLSNPARTANSHPGLSPSKSTGPRRLTEGTTAGEAHDGFVQLFNGKDIAGWTPWGSQGRLSNADAASIWWVRDGVLHGIGGPSCLFSPRGDYKNFRVRAEAMINDGGNSGLFLRTAEGPLHPPHYEAQINSTDRDPNKTGSLYRPPEPPVQVAPSPVPPDIWFTLEAEAVGGRIRIWVDDKPYVDSGDPRQTDTQGHIAIQAHHPGSHVQIRNLEVMELDQRGRPLASRVVNESGGRSRGTSARAGANPSKRGGRRAEFRPPNDAIEFRGKFYKVFPYRLSWHEARLKCQELGGHLAVVKSEAENGFLMSLMKRQGVGVVWLGATDERAEGRWVWVDGEPLRYDNWNPGQPNNKQGLEHYLITMVAHDGKWSDQPNNSVEASPGFICQWDKGED